MDNETIKRMSEDAIGQATKLVAELAGVNNPDLLCLLTIGAGLPLEPMVRAWGQRSELHARIAAIHGSMVAVMEGEAGRDGDDPQFMFGETWHVHQGGMWYHRKSAENCRLNIHAACG